MTTMTTNTAMPGPSAPAFRFTAAMLAALALALPGASAIANEAERDAGQRYVSQPAPPHSVQVQALTSSQARGRQGETISQSAQSQSATNQAGSQSVPRPTVQPPASLRPTPSELELAKLLWSTTAAVDHANISGNYSVLRDISAQRFQMNFNPARLTEIFSGLRSLNVDLSNALLVPPTYYEAPTMVANDVFRVRGMFQLRPIAIGFDAYYQWEQGRWKLFGIDLQPQQMTEAQPAAQP